MYTLITQIDNWNGTLYYSGGSRGDWSNYMDRITSDNIYFYPRGLETTTDNVSVFYNEQINGSNVATFVTNTTDSIPKFQFNYRIAAPFFENYGSSYVNDSGYYWNYSQLEYFIDSLPDYYGDYSSHEFSVYIQSYLNGTEKLAALIQKANDKGWTVYESY